MQEQIIPGLSIICADDLIYAAVEGVELDYLVTTPLEDGQRHYIPLEVVDHVDDGVYLTVTLDELKQML